jgi:hypothetical protein
MNYYHRYDQDGNCEVICTRCFATVGIADGLSAARKFEALHVCGKNKNQDTPKIIPIDRAISSSSESIFTRVDHLFGAAGKLKALNTPILFMAVVFLLYALPTVLELAATKHFNPWLAVILPGDVAGCACLITIFKMPRAGLALYLLLTICEAAFFGFHIVGAKDLIWIVDIVPTIAVTCLIMRARLPHGLRNTIFISHRF